MKVMGRILKFIKREKANNDNDPEQQKSRIRLQEYVAKVVNQKDTVLGESIAVVDRRIIVKNSESFLSIPLDAIKQNNENIIVSDFNREESLQLGKEWLDRKNPMKFDDNGMLIRES